MENDDEIGDESDDNSIMPPLLSKDEMDVMDSRYEYDAEPMSTEILEYIHDGIQSHPRVIRREARYKIYDCIKQRQSEWKGALKSMQNMSNFSQKCLRLS